MHALTTGVWSWVREFLTPPKVLLSCAILLCYHLCYVAVQLLVDLLNKTTLVYKLWLTWYWPARYYVPLPEQTVFAFSFCTHSSVGLGFLSCCVS